MVPHTRARQEHPAPALRTPAMRPSRPTTLRPSTDHRAPSRRSLPRLDEAALARVVGGSWRDGGITAEDDWESPVT